MGGRFIVRVWYVVLDSSFNGVKVLTPTNVISRIKSRLIVLSSKKTQAKTAVQY